MRKRKFLLIIPARDGSKGVKNKNLKIVGRKRLIDYAISTAISIKIEGEKIISTDIQEIFSDTDAFLPVTIPFKRPKKLSTDKATAFDVVEHSLKWFKKKKELFENIILLQPTNPFRKHNLIQEAINFYIKNNLKSLAAITEVWQHPSEIVIRNENEFVKVLNEDEGRRQDFSKSFFISGALYIISVDLLLDTRKFLNHLTYYYELNPETALDIDNEFQLKLANSYAKIYEK